MAPIGGRAGGPAGLQSQPFLGAWVVRVAKPGGQTDVHRGNSQAQKFGFKASVTSPNVCTPEKCQHVSGC